MKILDISVLHPTLKYFYVHAKKTLEHIRNDIDDFDKFQFLMHAHVVSLLKLGKYFGIPTNAMQLTYLDVTFELDLQKLEYIFIGWKLTDDHVKERNESFLKSMKVFIDSIDSFLDRVNKNNVNSLINTLIQKSFCHYIAAVEMFLSFRTYMSKVTCH